MDELLKVIRYFVTRDVLYIIGGSAVLLSFLHLFDKLSWTPRPTALYLLFAAIAYPVGYAIQDSLAVLGVISSRMEVDPPSVVKRLYQRFTRSPWKEVPNQQDLERFKAELPDGPVRYQLERIITLQQVGTSVGPAFLVSAAFMVTRWLSKEDGFDLAVAVAGLLLGTLLTMMGWIKAAQQAQLLLAHARNGQGLTPDTPLQPPGRAGTEPPVVAASGSSQRPAGR
jgi:hypothetical protein